MHTRKLFSVAAASFVALASVFIGQAPANASITTYISVLPQSGTKMVLDTKMDSSTANGMANGAPAQLWQLRTASPGVEVRNQRWIITVKYIDSDNHGVYELKNQLSQKCLDMAIDGPIGNSTRVQQWDCSGASNQRWKAVPAPADLGSEWSSSSICGAGFASMSRVPSTPTAGRLSSTSAMDAGTSAGTSTSLDLS